MSCLTTFRGFVSIAALFSLMIPAPVCAALGDIYPSPDGSKLASVAVNGEAIVIRIWQRNPGGVGWRIIGAVDKAPESVWDPRWSPDGTKIALVASNQGQTDIVVANVDGSAYKNLTATGLTLPRTDEYDPAWSPDGSKIAFLSDTGISGNDVWVMNADGSGKVKLSERTLLYSDVGWLPGSSGRVSYYSPLDGFYFFPYAGGSPIPPFPDTRPSIAAVVLSTLRPTVDKISPGSIATIFGTNFTLGASYATDLDEAGRVETLTRELCVLLGEERVPVFAVTPTQVNFQIPPNLSPGPYSVVVARDCGLQPEQRSEPFAVTVEEATPAFFTYYIAAGNVVTPHGYVAGRHQNGANAVAPSNASQDQYGPTRPARRGDLVQVYGTGWGPTAGDSVAGELATGAAALLPAANPIVTLGGVPLPPQDVLYVGLAPGAVGLYQVNIRIPQSAPVGNQELTLTVYGKTSPVGPVIPIAE